MEFLDGATLKHAIGGRAMELERILDIRFISLTGSTKLGTTRFQ